MQFTRIVKFWWNVAIYLLCCIFCYVAIYANFQAQRLGSQAAKTIMHPWICVCTTCLMVNCRTFTRNGSGFRWIKQCPANLTANQEKTWTEKIERECLAAWVKSNIQGCHLGRCEKLARRESGCLIVCVCILWCSQIDECSQVDKCVSWLSRCPVWKQ